MILWDFNGTILDDAQLALDTENGLLRKRGLPALTMRRYREIFCFPVKEYYRRAGFDFDTDSFEALAAEYDAAYQPASLQCDVRRGVRMAINALRERGIRQGVLSASLRSSLLTQMEALGLTDAFDVILGLDDIYAQGKADIAKQWMEREGINPSELILLGDTVHDHEVALELNAACALLLGGHQDEKRLRATGRPVFADVPAWLAWMLTRIVER